MSLGCYFGNQGFFLFPFFGLFTPLLLYIEARTILAGELIVPWTVASGYSSFSCSMSAFSAAFCSGGLASVKILIFSELYILRLNPS